MTDRSADNPLSRPRVGAYLFAVLTIVYMANMDAMVSGDTITSVHAAWNLVARHTLHLDKWLAWDLAYTPMGYAISQQSGHWVSNYPLLPALLAVPLMAVFHALGILTEQTAHDAAKLTAAMEVALSAVLLWDVFRRRTTGGRALLFAACYGLATASWSTSSQSLWQHAVSQLVGAWIVWLLVVRGGRVRSLAWLGLACGLLVCGRPADLSVAALVALHVVWRYRAAAWRFAWPAVVCAAGLLAYNLSVFGTPLGGYAVLNGPHAASYFDARGVELAHNLAAILVSPNRGLFVFTPLLAFCVWGMARAIHRRREEPDAPDRLFVVIAVVFVLQMASYGWWWGGHSYGYRLLTDVLPFVCFFWVRLPEDLFRRRAVAAVFACLLAFSVFVQYVGAFHYPRGDGTTARSTSSSTTPAFGTDGTGRSPASSGRRRRSTCCFSG